MDLFYFPKCCDLTWAEWSGLPDSNPQITHQITQNSIQNERISDEGFRNRTSDLPVLRICGICAICGELFDSYIKRHEEHGFTTLHTIKQRHVMQRAARILRQCCKHGALLLLLGILTVCLILIAAQQFLQECARA